MEMLFPGCEALEPGDIYKGLSLPAASRERPYTAVNMVTTVDGKATLESKAQALGSKVDHMVMRQIRAAADAVLVGAETLRRENVNPGIPRELEASRQAMGMAPQPLAIVVTGTGDLPLDRTFFRSPLFARVVVTTERAPAERISRVEQCARVVRVGEDAVDLRLMMLVLSKDLGIRHMVVEGGPSLNRDLIAMGLVDELFWTVAPKILGGAALRTMVEGRPLPLEQVPHLQLVSLYHHLGELFLRYRFPSS